MPSEAQKLPNEPIILRILGADIQSEQEMKAGMLADIKLLDTQSEPVFLILDMTNSPVTRTLDSVAVGANMATRQLPLFKHRNVREVVFVTTNRMMSLVAEGLDSEIYGYVKARAVGTVDEALAYARNAKQSKFSVD